MFDPTSLSGREHHIFVKAFALAIEVINALPKELKSVSDQTEMKQVLDKMVPQDEALTMYQEQAKRYIAAVQGK
jgi:hypothetical protein